jgi:prolipoprotein diacylglyceryltransferase
MLGLLRKWLLYEVIDRQNAFLSIIVLKRKRLGFIPASFLLTYAIIRSVVDRGDDFTL